MLKEKTNVDKVGILMEIARGIKAINPEVKNSYGNLFDKLMDKAENNPVLFDYIYNRIKNNVLDKLSVVEQKKLFLELMEADMEYVLKQELSCHLNS